MPALNNKRTHQLSGPIGAITGLIVSAAFQPLQTIKMYLILGKSNNATFIHRLSNILSSTLVKNGWKGFWNGLTPAILKNTLGSSLYFSILRNIQKLEDKSNLQKPKNAFINSALARMASCILINPISVIQTRFLLPDAQKPKNIMAAFKNIIQFEGKKSFLKGSIPVCYKQGIFAGIYYQLYVNVKSKKEEFDLIDSFGSGLFAGTIATIFSHPFEIVRARMQSGMSFSYAGIIDGFSSIYSDQGLRGFSKGLLPRLARKPLINSCTFLIYEALERKLNKHFNDIC